MAEPNDSPLKFAKGGRVRVGLDAEALFGNRRWVLDKDGKLVERYGPPREGETDVVRTFIGGQR